MKKNNRISVSLVAALVIMGGLLSCGLEDYSYLPSVPQSNIIEVQLTNKATIHLPNLDISPDGSYNFTHFSFLYRIYVSGQLISGQAQTSATALRDINSTLASDYSAIYESTNITNNSANNTNSDSLFRNRGYYELSVEGSNITSVLDSYSRDKTVVIEFPPNNGEIPTMTVGSNKYNLVRSRGSNSSDSIQRDENNPLPLGTPYFLNYDDLNNPANINRTEKTNLDVAGSSASPRYSYISLYIILVGLDNAQPIYSRPTFIGILKLPES